MPLKTIPAAAVASRFPRPKSDPKPPDLRPPMPVSPVCLEARESSDEAGLNKTERAWLEVLRGRRLASIRIQAFTLKLGDRTRYTPDFSAVVDGRMTFYEVKGFMRDDAAVKLKTAARAYPEFDFVLVRRVKGKWEETEVKR